MPKLLKDFIQDKIDEWGNDNPFFGFSQEGELVEQWTTDLDGLEIFYSYIRNSRWIKITVLPTQTGIHPYYDFFRWKGYINEWIAEAAVWWAFELLTENEARKFMIQNKPSVRFQFIRLGHNYDLTTTFDGYNWIIEC